ncbi:MAG: sulfite exporter TauE/SafE family protein [Bacteroidota bacterium]
MDFLVALSSGFLLGCLHSFDVDHVTAVSAFVANNPGRRSAMKFGLFWGLGHTTTLLVLGLATVAFKFAIPAVVQTFAEAAVGIILVALGVWTSAQFFRHRHIHLHKHTHDGVEHTHFHSHNTERNHRHHHSMFAIGATHGLAGTASVMVIIPLTIARSLPTAAAFLALFGLGTVLSMSLAAALLGTAARALDRSNVLSWVRLAAGLSSIALGTAWIGMNVL